MLEELRRCNSIGDKGGIEFFSKLIFEGTNLTIDGIENNCNFNSQIKINPRYSILTFLYLEIITLENTNISLTVKGRFVKAKYTLGLYWETLTAIILRSLISKGIITSNNFKLEIQSELLYYEITHFPLNAAVFRNLLFEIGKLQIVTGKYLIKIDDKNESFITKSVHVKNRKITEAELLQALEQNRIQGEIAEKWVYEYEKNRLECKSLAQKIKIVSKIDVTAGFDLVSFDSAASEFYDRFIEVKSFRSFPHFYWSKNEREVALLKGYSYYLYLVDLDKINYSNYHPIIIRNPRKELPIDSSWLIESETLKISKVAFD